PSTTPQRAPSTTTPATDPAAQSSDATIWTVLSGSTETVTRPRPFQLSYPHVVLVLQCP
ncbi:hypothetical protein BaRGS_00001934, partial [Batillaria attramentaria]